MKVVITLCLTYILFHDSLCAVEKSGPYKSTLVKTGPCQNPNLRIDKNPSMVFYIEIYNTSKRANLVKGTVQFIRDTKNKRIKVKAYYWEEGGWKIHYIMNNMGCHSVILPVLTSSAGVKYDRKNCNFYKGKYTFSDIDTNKVQHLWIPEQEYGRIKWVHEIFSPTGIVSCWVYETLVEPIN